MQSDLLFVYGTLLDKDNEFGAYLSANSEFYADGRVRGRLYDLGEYPAAITDENAPGFVYGKIYRLLNAPVTIGILDDYEGIGNDYPEPHEYLRALKSIETDNGDILCWMYLYNLDINNLKQITSGKY